MAKGWMRMGAVALGLGLAGSAWAADDVAPGATVLIKKVSRQDAFFYQRKSLIGLLCAVEADGLHSQGKGKWVGGSVTCVDGQNYYFYKVAVEEGYFGVDYAGITGHALGEAVVSDSPWQVGARVQITGISPDDAHVQSAPGLVGQACTVKDAPMESTGDVWFSGQLKCDNGIDLYFYQVSVVAAGGAPAAVTTTTTTTTAASAGSAAPAAAYPAGKMVKIVDIAPSDLLHAEKATLIGRTCSVVESALVDTGDGWLAGRFFCDDGKSYQAFKVKVAAP
ncbi:MAG: hypothetical protein ACK4YP_04445 [Myxococcota bacterium]